MKDLQITLNNSALMPIHSTSVPSFSSMSSVPLLASVLEKHSLERLEAQYRLSPTPEYREKLLSAINRELVETRLALRQTKAKQQAAHQVLMTKTSPTSLVGRFWGWVAGNLENNLETTPEQLMKNYSRLAKIQKQRVKQLTRARNQINSGSAGIFSGMSKHVDMSLDYANTQSFSTPNFTYPASFDLSCLTGQNGFKLDGENNGDGTGGSVSAAGDINGDGYDDLIIGAYAYSDYKGRSYVIFGGLEIGSSGLINLTSLNGSNGFKLDGENNEDYSGYSVSAAGDINGDGHDDLIIGALGYPGSAGNGKGRSYVVFGRPGIGSSGVLALSSLNGSNGFKLDGENQYDQSGNPASYAVDINGDGHDDLIIGAMMYGYPSHESRGRSYVVFGGPRVGSGG